MLGYELTEELHRRDLATEIFRHPGEYQRFTELLNGAEQINDVEMEWKRQDGTTITVRCSGHRVEDESSASAYFEGFAADVTKRRRLEKQLRMSQKMVTIAQLLGGL